MRQNLLGTNLLNMSLYNAAAQRGQIPNHPGAQHHLQYAMAEGYLPVSYDIERQNVPYDHTGMYGVPLMNSNDMYRLPPIDNMGLDYDSTGQWAHQDSNDFWQIPDHSRQSYGLHDPSAMQGDPSAYPPLGYDPTVSVGNEPYHLPPLIDPYGPQDDHSLPPTMAPFGNLDNGLEPDPRMHEWARDGQQTPSGHVTFNERLFDGALGSAGLPPLGDVAGDADLAGFDEAIAQANELSQW